MNEEKTEQETKAGVTFKGAGEVIREAREAQGLTQLDISEALGLNLATISQLENGSTRTGKVTLNYIAIYLGIEFALIFPYDNKTDNPK